MSRFGLPVLKASSSAATPDDLMRLALHTEEIYESAQGEKAAFDFGLAIYSKEHPRLTCANQVRDITMSGDVSPEQMISQVDSLFASHGLTCRQWNFSDARVPEQMRVLLAARGFIERKGSLHRLQTPGKFETARQDLTVIPGRASFTKLQELTATAERAWGTTSEASIAQYESAAIRVLDDSQVDNLLVLDGQTPVGTAYLVTAAECGLIADFYVHPDHVRKHVATTLMERLIELAARSRLRHVLLFCDDGNTAAQALYEKSGFIKVRDGHTMELPTLDQA